MLLEPEKEREILEEFKAKAENGELVTAAQIRAELIERLGKKYTLACLSNSNALHWPRAMNEMGLGKMLQYHFSSHITGKLKPDKESFEYALQQLNCEPEAVVFLDDNEINVNSAREMGITAYRARGPKEVEHILHTSGLLH